MFDRIILVLLFITSSPAFGAPQEPQPDTGEDLRQDNEDQLISDEQIPMDTMQVTPPPDVKSTARQTTKPEPFYPYQSSISPRIGLVFGGTRPEAPKPVYLIGFAFMFDSPTSKHTEIVADLLSDSTGLLHGSYRWILRQHSSFRPFYKLGASLLIEASDRLASILQIGNYQVRGAIGFEWLISNPVSFRLDAEVGAGMKSFFAAIIVGYSWAW